MIRELCLISIIFSIVEMIKELVFLTSESHQFKIFYYYLGYLSIVASVLISTYKLAKYLNVFLITGFTVMCIFFCILQFYIDNIKYTHFIYIAALLFQLRGQNWHIITLICISFLILSLNLTYLQFNSQEKERPDIFKIEAVPELYMFYVGIIKLIYIVMWVV